MGEGVAAAPLLPPRTKNIWEVRAPRNARVQSRAANAALSTGKSGWYMAGRSRVIDTSRARAKAKRTL